MTTEEIQKRIKALPLDLAGKTVGSWKLFGIASPGEDPLWICRCECGTVDKLRQSELLEGQRPHCGCKSSQMDKEEVARILAKYYTAPKPQQSHPQLRGEKNPRWKGGPTKYNGYVRIQCPGHPRADRDGQVGEHVLVMEADLGRHLEGSEEVHHKNLKKWDNDIENLQLMEDHRAHMKLHAELRRQGLQK